MERVLITGMGACTPLGITVDTFWNKLIKGESGISKIESFETDDYRTKIAGIVNGEELESHIEAEDKSIYYDRCVTLSIVSYREILKQENYNVEDHSRKRVGVIIGTGSGNSTTIEEQLFKYVYESKRVNPFAIPKAMFNSISAFLSILFKAKEINFTVNTACSAGNYALALAYDYIKNNQLDICITGGVDSSLTPGIFKGWDNLRVLSDRNSEPEKASRPFSKDRNGFVLSEGAGMVLLESLKNAEERNANVYAEVLGYGMSSDAFHITKPQLEGQVAATQAAIKNNSLDINKINYISAHGTATYWNDLIETQVIKEVFGPKANEINITGIKSSIGHTIGASGTLALISTVKAINSGIIPPTINLDNPDPECDLNYTPNKSKNIDVDIGLVNAFGFGGSNIVVALKKFID